jgi:hypothetical protein
VAVDDGGEERHEVVAKRCSRASEVDALVARRRRGNGGENEKAGIATETEKPCLRWMKTS